MGSGVEWREGVSGVGSISMSSMRRAGTGAAAVCNTTPQATMTRCERRAGWTAGG